MVCSFISSLKPYISRMLLKCFPFLFMSISHVDVYKPPVINQEGDMVGISQAQGQHSKWDMLINTAITSTP